MRISTVLLASTITLSLLTSTRLFGQSQQTEILPSKDNTLYESSTGAISNGAGTFLFLGLTNRGEIRRALLAFDVAGNVPAGAIVESASLQVTVSKTIAGATDATLHQVLQDWGEGTSDAAGSEGSGTNSTANDATWRHTFFDTEMWQAAGGDFAPGSFSAASVSSSAVEFPSTPQFASLVQSWLDTPAGNFGLVIVGDENTSPSAKQIGSREGVEANRPRLLVTYSVPTATEDAQLPNFLTSLSAYPNPAYDVSTLSYELRDTRHVRIDVVDVTGRIVATPVSRTISAGEHNAVISTHDLSPGLYLVRLQSGTQAASRTIVVQ